MINKLKSLLASFHEKAVCRFTPCCDEMTRLISEAHERPLGPLLRLRMRLHYGICVWCLRYRDQLDLIRELIRQIPASADDGRKLLSEETKQRLREKLRGMGK